MKLLIAAVTLLIVLIFPKISLAATNTFNCKYEPVIGCVVGTDNCSPGYGADDTVCTSITDENTCVDTINIACTSTAPPKYACNNGQCTQDIDGTYDSNDCDGKCEVTLPGNSDAVPKPYVKCENVRPDLLNPLDEEFHSSLRPYQSSPCNLEVENTAAMCGSTLYINDPFKVGPNDGKCTTNYEVGITICEYDLDREFDIFIDTQNARLPIAGNTELVKNSQQPDDIIDEAERVNEYLSWYLNGVDHKAEEPTYSIDFAGPIKKLLPQPFQQMAQIATVLRNKIDEHNRVVVCGSSEDPSNCYAGNETGPKEPNYRLNDWKPPKDLGPFRSLANILLGLLKNIPGINGTVIADSLNNAWNLRIPPLPWGNNMEGVPFASNKEYFKAYNEWRGKTCVLVPVFEWLFCFDIKLGPVDIIPNSWSQLFPFVPLQTAEDRKGKISLAEPGISGHSDDMEVNIIDFGGKTESEDLYFAHVRGLSNLSSMLTLLQNPRGVENGSTTNVKEPEIEPGCKILKVRSNIGDDLFGKSEAISAHLKYNASFDCVFATTDPENSTETCEKEVTFSAPVNTDSPEVDTSWINLVAGNASVFKRIFPKLDDPSFGALLDMPTVTETSYRGSGASVGPSPADLYIPHLGGLKEYILTGIQTMLRPKGYGNQIEFDKSMICNEFRILPKAKGACLLGSTSSKVGTIPTSFRDILQAAAETFKTPPNLILGAMYGEGAFSRGLDWSDENVKSWAMCTKIPGCSDDIPIFWGFTNDYWKKSIAPRIWPELKKLDPNWHEPTRCNIIDYTYGAAYQLNQNASGSPAFAGKSCFGINLIPGNRAWPTTCDWDREQYETSIRVWEFGTGYGNTSNGLLTCATNDGSCYGGGGVAAQCSTDKDGGPYDSCQTIGDYPNGVMEISHNACVWEVSQGI